MTNLATFGSRIRQKRIELNMTQTELAKRTGYTSRSSINKIELGLVDLPQSKIIAISKALKCLPTHLMGWTEETEHSGEKFSNGTNDDETDMLLKYRTLSEQQKKLINAYMDGMMTRMQDNE
jgi:transcriptional regulator with XRE-family HTH domain